MSLRLKGYVIAADVAGNNATIYKVRVRADSPIYAGKKLIVLSTHNNITIAKGLNVDFEIGTINDQQGHPVLCAIDVAAETNDPNSDSSKGT